MAPNSAMKVPVFPILLSPSSPQISPSGLEREEEAEGGGGGRQERQKKKLNLTNKSNNHKCTWHLKLWRVKRKASEKFLLIVWTQISASRSLAVRATTPRPSALLWWGIFGDFFFIMRRALTPRFVCHCISDTRGAAPTTSHMQLVYRGRQDIVCHVTAVL